MKTKSFLVLGILIMHIAVIAQVKIGNNPTTINSASLLELETTNQGFVMPRVSISSISSSSPLASGLLTGTIVYNTNSGITGGSGAGIYLWDGTKWVVVSTGASASSSSWLLTGNSGLSSANFLGTTDNVSMRFRTNNIQRLIIDSLGNVGIGISNPGYALSVLAASNPLYLSGLQATATFTADSILTVYNGVVKKAPYSALTASTTNSLNLSGNTLTSTVNGVAATSSAVSGINNTSSANTLSTTINGVTGATVPIINSNTKTWTQSGGITTTVNGVASNITPASGTITNVLGYNSTGAPVYQAYSSVSPTDWHITGNSGTTSGNFLGTTDNVSMRFRTNNIQRMIIDSLGNIGIGISNPAYALSVLSASNPLYLSGVQTTAALSTDSVLTIYNGVVKKSPSSAFIPVTTNTLALSGNTLTSTVNGVAATSSAVSGVNNTSSANILSTTVNGVAGTTVPIINTNTNTLTQAGGLVNTVNGVAATTPIATGTVSNVLGYNASGTPVYQTASTVLSGATTNVLNLSGNALTSTVNGVAATSSAVSGVNNTSSANALSTTVNGIAGTTVPIINTNTNTLTQAGGLVTTVNGVAATTPIATGTVNNVLGYDASGTPVYQSINNINLSTAWNLTGNTGTTAGTNYIGTTDNVDFVTKTNGTERMRVLANGHVGIGITNPSYTLGVKDTMEIRRVGSLSTLLFTNTAGTGDFRIGGDGGDIFWQGGGGRALQMGSYWTTILGGDRQTSTYPAFISSLTGTSVLVLGQRDASVPLGVQANSTNQSANLTEWRNSAGTVLSALNKNGYLGIGTASPSYPLSVFAASNPLYLSGVQNTSTFTTDSILTINAGIVKKAAYSALSGSTTNTLALSGNVLTSTVNGVAATSSAVSSIGNTSSANTLSTTVNGIAGTTVPIINTNTNTLTQAGGLVTTVNGVAATTPIATGTVSNVLGYNASGAPVYQTASTVLNGATTHTLTLSTNTLTSTVNGVVATSNSVSGVGNTSSANILSTTVNGVAGTTVPIINTNTNTLTQAGGLVNTVNGVAATTPIATGTVSNVLGYNASGAPVYQTASTVLSGATTNVLNLSGNALTSTVNGVAATSSAVSGVNNTSSANTLSTTVNGVAGTTVPIINTNTNTLTQAGGLVTNVNGVAATTPIATGTVSNVLGYNASGAPVYQTASTVLNGATTHTLTLSTNTLTSTVNGVVATSSAVSGVNNTSSANTLSTTVNGVAGTTVPIINTNTNTLTQAGGLVTTVNGVAATTSFASGTINKILGFSSTGVPVYQSPGALADSVQDYDWRKAGNLNPSAPSDTVNNIYHIGGNVGIGTSSSTAQLDVNGTARIRALGSSASTDSVVTADSSGNLRKRTINDLINNSGASNNFWNIAGNAGTNYATNFLGTTDNVSTRFRTNNIQRMIIDSIGSVGIGSTAFDPIDRERLLVDYGNTTSNTVASFEGSVDDYFQINLQNKSGTGNASTDFVATANDGTDSTYYVDMGINSSNYAFAIDNWGQAHDAYLYSYSKNLYIGTQAASSDVIFLVGGGRAVTNAALRIRGNTGNIVVGKGDASATPLGNILRGPNGYGTNIIGGNLTIQGGSSTGSATAGTLYLIGGTVSGITPGSTVNNAPIIMNTSNIERMRIDSVGNIGIGTTNPAYKLSVLAGSNPLYLSGVQTTAGFATDSLLTIYNGVVKKTPSSSLLTAWNLTGNSGTAPGANRIGTSASGSFLGTTDNKNFTIATNNISRITFDQAGNAYGGGTGTNISSSANGSFAWGDSNLVYGKDALVTGYLNIDSSKNSFVFGNNNVLGAGTVQTNRGTLLGGGQNVVTNGNSYNSIISGSQNTLTGDNFESFVTGYLNNVTGSQKVIVSGQQNAVTSTAFSTISGGFNTIGSMNYGTIFGGGNVINAGSDYGVTIGQNNIIAASSPNSMALGKNVTATTSAQFAANFNGGYNFFTTPGASTATTPDLTITTAGNVGIGISNPSYPLSVLAASNPLYLSGVQATSTFSADSILTINAGIVKKAAYSSLATSGNWSITGNSGTNSTNFLGTTDNISMRFRTNNLQRMIIDSLGKVGIGTNTPASDLTLYQSAGSAGSSKGFTFTGNSISGVSSGTGVLMTLGYNSAGNKQLWFGDGDYAGVASGSFARFVANGTNFPTFDAVSGDGASRRYLALGVANDANSGVIFGTDNSGTNPGSLVWGNGNMAIGSGYKSYAAPSNGLLVQGNVGIGTTNPSSALSVLAASNPLYLSGVQATSTFSTDSILTINAGIVKKTPYSSLPSGSGSGWSLAGNNITSGQFLGTTNALPLILKANNNQIGSFDGNIGSIALGLGAVNNTSDHNIAIGYNANTNNQYTLALGYNSSATGVRAVAIGNGAAATVASGGESVAVGYNATSSGNQSIALGWQANSSGQFGVALGYTAQATALQSTAIGYAAQATAQYSNAIGYQAQAGGIQSTAIGYQAQTNQANTILLGNAATNNLYVGIGTATPTSKLHIVGTNGNNPLQLVGLPAGVAGTDNILTVNSSGVVGSVTPANFNSNYWGLNGNAAAAGNFLGTTNTTPLQFKFNSTVAGYLDANNTAFGTSATATAGTQNTSIGYNSTAANNATALGASATAANTSNTAIGNSATANNSDHETSIGASSVANAQYNTALGYNAQAVSNAQATAIGTASVANGNQATALGYGAQAISNGQTTALGANSLANAQYNTAVGYGAQAISNSQATAIGYNSKANAQYSVAIGYNAQAINNQQTTAIGSSSQATGTSSNAIGFNAQATNTQATADGAATIANAANASAFGYGTQATGTQSTALGSATLASGTQSNAIGYNAQATSGQATAEGASATATAANASALGYNAQSTNTQTTAIGSASLANQPNATAVGYNAKAQGANSSAIGYNAQTSQSNALILGDATNTSLAVGIGTATPNTAAKLDVAGTFKLGSVGTVLSNLIKGTATVNIGAIGIGGTSSTTFTVPNAIVGAIVAVSPKATLPYSVVIGYAYVSAANTVTIVFGVGGTATSGFTTTLDVSILQ